jgi:uncharacterized membrane protein YadS
LLRVPRLTGLPCSWAVIFAGISLTATYIEGTGCAIIHTKANMISAVFIYSMGFGESFGSSRPTQLLTAIRRLYNPLPIDL